MYEFANSKKLLEVLTQKYERVSRSPNDLCFFKVSWQESKKQTKWTKLSPRSIRKRCCIPKQKNLWNNENGAYLDKSRLS